MEAGISDHIWELDEIAGLLDAKEQAVEQATGTEGHPEPENETDRHQHERLPENHPDDVPGASSERHPDPDLVGSLRDAVRSEPEKTDRGEQHGEDGEP